jgi:hypothetical protein
MTPRLPVPPSTRGNAIAKVRVMQGAWNIRDPALVRVYGQAGRPLFSATHRSEPGAPLSRRSAHTSSRPPYDKTARISDVSGIPKGNLFHIACAWLPDHDLTGVAKEYGLTNLDPICEGDLRCPILRRSDG